VRLAVLLAHWRCLPQGEHCSANEYLTTYEFAWLLCARVGSHQIEGIDAVFNHQVKG
jgi:hypothetical protein